MKMVDLSNSSHQILETITTVPELYNTTTASLVTQLSGPVVTESSEHCNTTTASLVTQLSGAVVTEPSEHCNTTTASLVTQLSGAVVTESSEHCNTTTASLVTQLSGAVVTESSEHCNTTTASLVTQLSGPVVTESSEHCNTTTASLVTQLSGAVVTESSEHCNTTTASLVTQLSGAVVTEPSEHCNTTTASLVTQLSGVALTEPSEHCDTTTASLVQLSGVALTEELESTALSESHGAISDDNVVKECLNDVDTTPAAKGDVVVVEKQCLNDVNTMTTPSAKDDVVVTGKHCLDCVNTAGVTSDDMIKKCLNVETRSTAIDDDDVVSQCLKDEDIIHTANDDVENEYLKDENIIHTANDDVENEYLKDEDIIPVENDDVEKEYLNNVVTTHATNDVENEYLKDVVTIYAANDGVEKTCLNDDDDVVKSGFNDADNTQATRDDMVKECLNDLVTILAVNDVVNHYLNMDNISVENEYLKDLETIHAANDDIVKPCLNDVVTTYAAKIKPSLNDDDEKTCLNALTNTPAIRDDVKECLNDVVTILSANDDEIPKQCLIDVETIPASTDDITNTCFNFIDATNEVGGNVVNQCLNSVNTITTSDNAVNECLNSVNTTTTSYNAVNQCLNSVNTTTTSDNAVNQCLNSVNTTTTSDNAVNQCLNSVNIITTSENVVNQCLSYIVSTVAGNDNEVNQFLNSVNTTTTTDNAVNQCLNSVNTTTTISENVVNQCLKSVYTTTTISENVVNQCFKSVYTTPMTSENVVNQCLNSVNTTPMTIENVVNQCLKYVYTTPMTSENVVNQCLNSVNTTPMTSENVVNQCLKSVNTTPMTIENVVNQCLKSVNTTPMTIENVVNQCLKYVYTTPMTSENVVNQCLKSVYTTPMTSENVVNQCLKSVNTTPMTSENVVNQCLKSVYTTPMTSENVVNQCLNSVNTTPMTSENVVNQCLNSVNTTPMTSENVVNQCLNSVNTTPMTSENVVNQCLNSMSTTTTNDNVVNQCLSYIVSTVAGNDDAVSHCLNSVDTTLASTLSEEDKLSAITQEMFSSEVTEESLDVVIPPAVSYESNKSSNEKDNIYVTLSTSNNKDKFHTCSNHYSNDFAFQTENQTGSLEHSLINSPVEFPSEIILKTSVATCDRFSSQSRDLMTSEHLQQSLTNSHCIAEFPSDTTLKTLHVNSDSFHNQNNTQLVLFQSSHSEGLQHSLPEKLNQYINDAELPTTKINDCLPNQNDIQLVLSQCSHIESLNNSLTEIQGEEILSDAVQKTALSNSNGFLNESKSQSLTKGVKVSSDAELKTIQPNNNGFLNDTNGQPVVSRHLPTEGLQQPLTEKQCVELSNDDVLRTTQINSYIFSSQKNNHQGVSQRLHSEGLQHSVTEKQGLDLSNDAVLKTKLVNSESFPSKSSSALMTCDGMQDLLTDSYRVEFPSGDVKRSSVVNCDSVPSQSISESVTAERFVYSSVSLLTDLKNANQLVSDDFIETQDSYVFDPCISTAREDVLHDATNSFTEQLSDSGFLELCGTAQSEEVQQDMLSKHFQPTTLNNMSSKTLELDAVSTSSSVMSNCLPVYQASTETIDCDHFCESSLSVQSSVAFSSEDVLSSPDFSERETALQRSVSDPLLHENLSLCSMPVLETNQMSYTDLPYSVDVPALNVLSPIMDCTSSEPSFIESATPSPGLITSVDQCGVTDSFYFSDTNNYQITLWEDEATENSVGCSVVDVGNYVEDGSMNEIVGKSNNSAHAYFDLYNFMSSTDNSPRNTPSKLNKQCHTDNEQFSSKLKTDGPNDEKPKRIFSPKFVISKRIPKNKSKNKGLKSQKTKPVKQKYVKSTHKFSNKSDLTMNGDLQPFCDCTDPSDEDLMLSDQTFFSHGHHILLPQIRRLACCGFELIGIHRGLMKFVCVKQVVSFGLMQQALYEKIRKCFPAHTSNMTHDEILFVKYHTGLSHSYSEFTLVSLELLAFALDSLQDNKKKCVIDHNEPLFCEIRLGHHCKKTRSLIKTVSSLEKPVSKKTYTCKAVSNRKRTLSKAVTSYNSSNDEDTNVKIKKRRLDRKDSMPSDNTMFVVDRPDGDGFCLAEVKTMLADDKQLLSFSWMDDTYINCLQLCYTLEDFPWENFQQLAYSLNVKFIDAPPEVQTYFTNEGYSKDVVSGKWTSVSNLRLISCFSVGQMNNTNFLIKNSILTKIAMGAFTEASRNPPDFLQLATTEKRDAVQDYNAGKDYNTMQDDKDYKKVSSRRNSKKSTKISLKKTKALMVSSTPRARKSETRKSETRKSETRKSETRKSETRKSETRKSKTRKSKTRKSKSKEKRVQENVYSSQMSSAQQDCSPCSEISDAALNREDVPNNNSSTSTYMHVNSSDFMNPEDSPNKSSSTCDFMHANSSDFINPEDSPNKSSSTCDFMHANSSDFINPEDSPNKSSSTCDFMHANSSEFINPEDSPNKSSSTCDFMHASSSDFMNPEDSPNKSSSTCDYMHANSSDFMNPEDSPNKSSSTCDYMHANSSDFMNPEDSPNKSSSTFAYMHANSSDFMNPEDSPNKSSSSYAYMHANSSDVMNPEDSPNKSSSSYAYNRAEFVMPVNCNNNIVFLESGEGSLFECTPLYSRQKNVSRLDVNMSSGTSNTEKSLVHFNPSKITSVNDSSQLLPAMDSGKFLDVFEESPRCSGNEFTSVDFSQIQDYYTYNDNRNSPSEGVSTVSPESHDASFLVNQGVIKSPDSGISLDMKLVTENLQLVHVKQNLNKQLALQETNQESVSEALDIGKNEKSVQKHTLLVSKSSNISVPSYTDFKNLAKLDVLADDDQIPLWPSASSPKELPISHDTNHVPMHTGILHSFSNETVDGVDELSKNISSKESFTSGIFAANKYKQRDSSRAGYAAQVCHESVELVKQCVSSTKSTCTSRSENTKIDLMNCEKLHVSADKTRDLMNCERLQVSADKTRDLMNCEGLQVSADKTREDNSKFQDSLCSKSQMLVTAFKKLMPMIHITKMAVKDDKLKFHLNLGPSIKHMLENSGEIAREVENAERFLKAVSRLVVRAHQYSQSQTTINRTLSTANVNTFAEENSPQSLNNQQSIFNENLLVYKAVEQMENSQKNKFSIVSKKRKRSRSVMKIDREKGVPIDPESNIVEVVQKKSKLTVKTTAKCNPQQRKPELKQRKSEKKKRKYEPKQKQPESKLRKVGTKQRKPEPKQRKSKTKHATISKNNGDNIGQVGNDNSNVMLKRKRRGPRKKTNVVTDEIMNGSVVSNANSMVVECIGHNTDFMTRSDFHSSVTVNPHPPERMFSSNAVFIPTRVCVESVTDSSVVHAQSDCQISSLFTNLNHNEEDLMEHTGHPVSSADDYSHIKAKQRLPKKRKYVEQNCNENVK